MNNNVRRVLAAVAALTLTAAACGSDDPPAATTVQMSRPTKADTTATAMPAMDGMAAGHTHETVEWPADIDVPELTLTVTPHEGGSLDLLVDTSSFTLQSGDGADDRPGAGHLHVSLDGRDAGMWFTPEISLQGIAPGRHQLDIRLSAPGHGMYAVSGDPLTYSANFEIPGDAPAVAATITISVDDSGVIGGIVDASVHMGDLVEIRIDSTITERVHLHVYDVSTDVSPGETATMTFTADIPGVFEAELEGRGIQILNLEVK